MLAIESACRSSMRAIRKEIYGPNYFHRKGISHEDDRRLEQFNSAGSKGSITMSYVGGIGGADTHLQIQADGSILAIDHGVSRKVCTLDQGRCSDFFKRVITSGLLNCSDEVIEIKRDLTHPHSMTSRFDAPSTEFRIFVPELDADKRIALDAEIELRNFPDIIEYQLVAALGI